MYSKCSGPVCLYRERTYAKAPYRWQGDVITKYVMQKKYGVLETTTKFTLAILTIGSIGGDDIAIQSETVSLPTIDCVCWEHSLCPIYRFRRKENRMLQKKQKKPKSVRRKPALNAGRLLGRRSKQSALTETSPACPQCGRATYIRLVEPHPTLLNKEKRTFECQECGLPTTYLMTLH